MSVTFSGGLRESHVTAPPLRYQTIYFPRQVLTATFYHRGNCFTDPRHVDFQCFNNDDSTECKSPDRYEESLKIILSICDTIGKNENTLREIFNFLPSEFVYGKTSDQEYKIKLGNLVSASNSHLSYNMSTNSQPGRFEGEFNRPRDIYIGEIAMAIWSRFVSASTYYIVYLI